MLINCKCNRIESNRIESNRIVDEIGLNLTVDEIELKIQSTNVLVCYCFYQQNKI